MNNKKLNTYNTSVLGFNWWKKSDRENVAHRWGAGDGGGHTTTEEHNEWLEFDEVSA